MRLRINKNLIHFRIGKFGMLYIPPWNWTHGNWLMYLLAIANDDESYWCRILGCEIWLMR